MHMVALRSMHATLAAFSHAVAPRIHILTSHSLAAFHPSNTATTKAPHLVYRIDIGAVVYEQLGHISRAVRSRKHQCCFIVLRGYVQPSFIHVLTRPSCACMRKRHMAALRSMHVTPAAISVVAVAP